MGNYRDLEEIPTKSKAIIEALLKDEVSFGLKSYRSTGGALIIKVISDTDRSAQAGALITALCQGGLAEVSISERGFLGAMHPFIECSTKYPKLATLDLQSAYHFEGFMLSGPAKVLLTKNFKDCKGDVNLNYIEKCLSGYEKDAALTGWCIAILQTDNAPTDDWIKALCEKAGCAHKDLTLVCAPQDSIAGATQIAGRMNENIIFTMENSLGLDGEIVDFIEGYAPICLPGSMTEEGKKLMPDDYLHFYAYSKLTLKSNSGVDPARLADSLAYSSLGMDNVLFIDLLEKAGGDFFKIPNLKHINKLAQVEVYDPDSKKTYKNRKLV
ncbi:MAG: hypothetical protein LBQ95_02350 [Lachnospiraceae bacterium]|jgi:methenyltetrahydromethanopterin cyclohydrolase|nr:hypothetical protein [Lachnospiraceae bacterium]